MKKKYILLLLIFPILLAGCSGNKHIDSIRIGEQFGLAYAPLQIMKEKGFLEKMRPEAEVEWLKLGNTVAIREAILAGDLDAGFMGIPPFLIARDKGMTWKIATGLSRSPLGLVVPKGKYKSLSDIPSGAKIALPQPGSIQHILLSMAAIRESGDPKLLDNNLIALKHPDGMNALLSGAVEGHFTSPPYLFNEADLENFEILLSGDQAMGSPFTFIVGAVTEDFYKENKALYIDFLSALEKSIDFINNEQEETVSILSQVYSMDRDLLSKYLYRPGMIFERDVRGVGNFIEFMFENDYISRKLSTAEVLF